MCSFHQNLLFQTLVLITLLISHFIKANDDKQSKENDLLVLTVATHQTDGFVRFNRSVNTYGLKLEVLGMNEKWLGGDVTRFPGGGHKVNLLKNHIEKYKNDNNKVILFVDSYDVIFTSSSEEILKRFHEMDAKVVFSAEGFCWPDESLESKYPKTDGDGKPFLNSGGFIGFAPQLYEMVWSYEIGNLDDDQLFYTKLYIDPKLREKWQIKLDHRANIFQNLNGAVGDVEIRFTADDSYIHNTAFQTNPLIIHGNGPSKVVLNSLGNYLSKSWHPKDGCLSCDENKISLDKIKNSELPRVLVGIFITHATPFINEFLKSIVKLKYPKKRISLFLYNSVTYHSEDVQKFVDENGDNYKRVTVFPSQKFEWEARNSALDECAKVNCDYYFSIDSDARITNSKTLIRLIEQNKSVIAPLLVRSNQLWSNFWGALSPDNYYSRSHDYIQIVKSERRGVWNVPFISQAYLINGSLLKGKSSNQIDDNHIDDNFSPTFYNSRYPEMDADMIFCMTLRNNGIFMFLMNLEDYGHLVTSSTFDITKKNPDFYEIYSNQKDWQRKYIHENYSKVLTSDYQIEQPCPDVFWFPVVSDTFCKHLIEIMENFGQWSAGKNYDPRLNGGYENVPTRDIHMNQVGFEQHWLYFLREYVRPVQEKVFTGYFHDPPKALMNFVVRYHPSEQAYLRPHHDSSTYTINIALNSPKVDFEGGGCRFIRYNCSVTDLRKGWSFIHPGRLTHYHEGLIVTKGTRYIMVSFVDP